MSSKSAVKEVKAARIRAVPDGERRRWREVREEKIEKKRADKIKISEGKCLKCPKL